MAGIDKTYCRTWEEYQEVVKWARENKFTCPNGTVIEPIESVYEWNEDSFDGERKLPILNTSQSLDYFLIKHCPIEIVQERMKEVYGEDYVESIKNRTSEYDLFVR